MIESSLAQQTYGASIQSTADEKNVEYKAFAFVTQALSALDKSALDYFVKKQEALFNNLQLWRILAVEVADENNPLPADLRANLFYLSEFTRKHTAKIHSGETDDPGVLIDINKSVMRGLRAQSVLQEAALQESALQESALQETGLQKGAAS